MKLVDLTATENYGYQSFIMGGLIAYRHCFRISPNDQTNDTAKRQYQKLGFRSFALEKNALNDEGIYYDEEQMVLFLNP